MQVKLSQFLRRYFPAGAGSVLSAVVTKAHFGEWLKKKRGGVPAKLFYGGDPRHFYNLENRPTPGRISGRVLADVAKAVKMEPGEVLAAWKGDRVLSVTLTDYNAARVERAAAVAGVSLEEWLYQAIQSRLPAESAPDESPQHGQPQQPARRGKAGRK